MYALYVCVELFFLAKHPFELRRGEKESRHARAVLRQSSKIPRWEREGSALACVYVSLAFPSHPRLLLQRLRFICYVQRAGELTDSGSEEWHLHPRACATERIRACQLLKNPAFLKSKRVFRAFHCNRTAVDYKVAILRIGRLR